MHSLQVFSLVAACVTTVFVQGGSQGGALHSRNVTVRKQIEADRTYYIACVEMDWDYAPNATNPFTGIKATEDEQASTYTQDNDHNRIGSIYRKSLYREFTDDTFTEMKEYDEDWEHLGLMGPPIRGVVGDRIKIIFLNNCTQNFSMHPHGVKYAKSSEGSLYETDSATWNKPASEGGQFVLPYNTWVYIWDVRGTEFNDLESFEFSSKFFFYHSHINEPIDTNSGLVGPIIITKKGYETSDDDPTPNDIDREFVTLFNVFDENSSWYIRFNLLRHLNPNSTWFKKYNDTFKNYITDFDYNDDEFHESNLMHSMNGLSWNVMGQYLNEKNPIKLGERVRWYIGAMGTEVDLHTAHWHGNEIITSTDYTIHDVVKLLPSYSTQVDMITDNPGTWFYHCHVNDHVEAGMIAAYTVVNETCTDCHGSSYDSVFDENSGSSGSTNDSATISDEDKWTIVGIAVGVNVLIIICIGAICYCRNRMGGDKRYNKSGSYAEMAA